ncbi:MAG: arylsulfatase [Pseudomonadota bacterium]
MISFLHTSPVHVATFDGLLDELSPGMARRHRVEEGWLEAARDGGMTADLAETIADAMRGLAAGGVGVCTCSTIGGVAEAAGSTNAPTIRIDRALMQAALSHGLRPLVAMCLESTKAPTLDLLDDEARAQGREAAPIIVMCQPAWRHFEAGDMQAYAGSIADTIRAELVSYTPDCIVLAQGSMAVAEPLLADTGLPVLSSPRLGVVQALDILAQNG